MKYYPKFMVSIMVAMSMAATIMGAPVEKGQLDTLKESTKQVQSKDMANRGLEVAQKLIDGKYAELIENMNEEAKAALNEATLAQSFKSVEQLYGAFKSYEFEEELKVGDCTQYNIRMVCEKNDLKLIVVFDQQGKISGLQIASYVKEKSKPKDSVEKEVVVQTGEYKLPATLMLPKEKGNFPIVVLVHGSGPNDRDETVSGVKVFRDIAYELAEQGIATLRYDKRTYVYADKVKENPSLFDYNEEVIDDAISAIELAKTLPEVNKDEIYVLGHSLGGMSIPMISTKAKDVAGYIMMAGPSRPLTDVIMEQIDYIYDVQGMDKEGKATYMANVEAMVKSIKSLTKESKVSELNFMGINNKTWADFNAYDQVKVAKGITKPTFIVQGGRDYQVTMEDFELWKKSLEDHKNIEFKDYPNLNHLFVEGEGKSTPNEYLTPAEVSKEFTNDLGAWILKKEK